MEQTTRITKEELITVIAENFKGDKDLMLNIQNSDIQFICKQIKNVNGCMVEFYYDKRSYVSIEANGGFWNKLFPKRVVVIAINTVCERLIIESGNIAMANVVATCVSQQGIETVVVDSKLSTALFRGKSKVVFSKFKGATCVVDSDVFATLCQTTSATFISSEIKMCRFATGQIKYVNEVVHDTTIDLDRCQLMKSLMTMKKNFESF